ncbi:hypothetical protein [Streptomyces sp. NPDC048172]|uniref:hypothetical protein n=1 Tax=Streptomyces sp. NPDC048172 TaxID=3365505 RepID=UPI00372110D8
MSEHPYDRGTLLVDESTAAPPVSPAWTGMVVIALGEPQHPRYRLITATGYEWTTGHLTVREATSTERTAYERVLTARGYVLPQSPASS